MDNSEDFNRTHLVGAKAAVAAGGLFVLVIWFLLVSLCASSAHAWQDPAAGIEPVTDQDFYQDGNFSKQKTELGRLLFFDKVLSGNKNIACASCHHPTLGSTDGLTLGLGEGATGLGRQRRGVAKTPLLGRVPRNSQHLYFLGAKEFKHLFHDGRVEHDEYDNWESGFWTPAREQLPAGLENLLAAQAMFPVLSHIEMAGHKGENEVADAIAVDDLGGEDGAWARLAKRLQTIPGYVQLFVDSFDDVNSVQDIRFVHAANAIAAFETVAFRADDSAFDRYLETRSPSHLSAAAQQGMQLFYGEAGCAGCHSGKFQTDQAFHAIAMPQVGPGKNDGFDNGYWEQTGFFARLEDQGRYRVTKNPKDKYKFRTPSLRNVELTGPWGHSGAYSSLRDVVKHHANPNAALAEYTMASFELPTLESVIEQTATGSELIYRPVNPAKIEDYRKRDRWLMQNNSMVANLSAANELPASELTDKQVDQLVAFLKTFTDPASRSRTDLVPVRVPSGLPVDD